MVDKLSQDALLAVAQACDDVSQLIGRKLFCADERRWYAGEWHQLIDLAGTLMATAHAAIMAKPLEDGKALANCAAMGMVEQLVAPPQAESPTYIVQDYRLHVTDGELYIGLDFGFDSACWLYVPPVDDLEILGDTIEDVRQRMAWVRERNGRD